MKLQKFFHSHVENAAARTFHFIFRYVVVVVGVVVAVVVVCHFRVFTLCICGYFYRERASERERVSAQRKNSTRCDNIFILIFFSCILFAFILYLLFVIFCYFYFLVCFIFSVKFSAVSDLKITTAAPHGLHFSWTWTLKLMLMLMLLIISCLKFLRNSRHKFWIVIIIFWFWNLELGSDLACALRTL